MIWADDIAGQNNRLTNYNKASIANIHRTEYCGLEAPSSVHWHIRFKLHSAHLFGNHWISSSKFSFP